MYIINNMYEIQIHLNQTFCVVFCCCCCCCKSDNVIITELFKILRFTFQESIRIKTLIQLKVIFMQVS